MYVADSGNNRIQKYDKNGTFITTWGSKGDGDGQFDYPKGITIDPSNYVYVADTSNDRIQKFDSNGTFITKWEFEGSKIQGSEVEQLHFPLIPQNIASDRSGNLYVADTGNDRIQKFDIIDGNLTFITEWGTAGDGDGQFDSPTDIAVDRSSNVYVADTDDFSIQQFDNGTFYFPDSGNDRIQKFDSNGTFITKWGSKGDGDGQFDYPAYIAVDRPGNVYVADTANSRIQKFDSNGTFITKWGSYGRGDGQFLTRPVDIAIDLFDNVYVTECNSDCDADDDRIQKFDSNGTFIAKWGSYGDDDGQFDYPTDIAVDRSGNLYVS